MPSFCAAAAIGPTGKPDDPEQVIDALLFEAPRHQGSAVDFAHGFSPRDRLNFSREIMH